MIKSMTGFGKAECENDQRKFIIEIRTLNGKQADVAMKLPNIFKEREIEIRNELLSRLQRGKIEIYVTMDGGADDTTTQFNEIAIRNYYRQMVDIAERNNIPMPADILNAIVRLPEALKSERHQPDEQEWKILYDGIKRAVQQVNHFREQEGVALQEDMSARLQLIETYVTEVEKHEPQRMEHIRNRLRQSLIEYVGENAIDQNRFEQELIYFLDKIDVNEEKVRLRNHCAYFVSTMREGDGVGKKLGFIAQEMGREINTIGSKANNAEMQQIVIRMKDELEKIKELVMNVL